MALLLLFYDTVSGEVLLDDTNIKELNIQTLRSQIGYVGQGMPHHFTIIIIIIIIIITIILHYHH